MNIQEKTATVICKLDDIYIPPKGSNNLQVWSLTDPEPAVLEMKESINATGLLSKLILNLSDPKETDKKYTINDGNKRWTALKLKELDKEDKFDGTITVDVIQSVRTPEQRLLMQMSANAMATGIININFVDAFVNLERNKGWSIQEISKYAGLGVAQIQKMFKSFRLPEEVRDMMGKGKGKLSLINAVTLSQLVSKIDETEFADFVKQAIDVPQSKFGPAVSERLQEYKDDLKASSNPTKGEFTEPKPRLLGNSDMKALLVKAENAFEQAANQANELRLSFFKEIFQVTDVDIAKSKAAWDIKQKEKEEKKNATKEEKETASLLKAIEQVKAAGHKVA